MSTEDNIRKYKGLLEEWHALEADCDVLEMIAKRYPPDSAEYRAIERAAQAMLFILSSKTKKEFVDFVQKREQR